MRKKIFLIVAILAAIFSSCKEQDPGEYALEEKGSWFSLYENIDEAGNSYVSTDVCFNNALEKDFNYFYLNGQDDWLIRYGVRRIKKKDITIKTFLYGNYFFVEDSIFENRPTVDVYIYSDWESETIRFIVAGHSFKFIKRIHRAFDLRSKESYTYDSHKGLLIGPEGKNKKTDVDNLNKLISKYIKVRDIVIYQLKN